MTIRITYDSINLDLLIGPKGLFLDLKQARYQNSSGSGKIEQINLYGRQEIVLDAYMAVAAYYESLAWWSWARQGKVFSLAMDSGDVANTTLDGAAAAAQKVIPLTATTSLAADNICFIETAADNQFEIVEIASVSAGVSVTAKSNLNQAYASGDAFRHFEYYPELISMDKAYKPVRSGKYYRWSFKFAEVK